MSVLLRPILELIHLVYTIFVFIKIQWEFIYQEIIGHIHPRSLMLEENILNDCDTSKIKKLPQHLVVVIGSEIVSFHDLARFISWTEALGIPYISFYDQEGFIKKNSTVLREEFEKLKPDVALRIHWGSEFSKKSANSTSNGFKNTTNVNLLSYKDGKGDIIDLTKEIAQAVTLGALKLDEINCDLVNEKLKKNFPEPDLVIVCGRTFSPFGLLPWHIRVSSFLHIPTHHNLPPKKFIDALEKYGKCEQRFGK